MITMHLASLLLVQHISSDIFFTVRKVVQEPRYIFDAYLPGFQARHAHTAHARHAHGTRRVVHDLPGCCQAAPP